MMQASSDPDHKPTCTLTNDPKPTNLHADADGCLHDLNGVVQRIDQWLGLEDTHVPWPHGSSGTIS